MKNIILSLTLISLFIGCKEVIDLDLPYNNPRLVVVGIFSNQNEPCTITLTKTVKYNYTYNLNNSNFVENATVVIKDNEGNSDILTEQTPGTYITNPMNLTGVIGRAYSIEITTEDGEIWVSEPEIMKPVAGIESMYFERYPDERDEEMPELYKYSVFLDWHEPENETNYYLREISFFWRGEWQKQFGWNSVFNDKYINGADVIKDVLIDRHSGNSDFMVKLHQYSLTPDAYKFWNLVHQQVHRANENSTNAMVPLYGNVYKQNSPNEHALGYFQVSAVDETILHIDH